MSQITEQEAREAAERLATNGGERWSRIAETDYRESVEYEQDVQAASEWALQELSRRDAERAERAKPITTEWLESIGWKKQTTHGGSTYHEFGLFHWFKGVVSFCSCKLETVTTRGQLLDLLKALRGGT